MNNGIVKTLSEIPYTDDQITAQIKPCPHCGGPACLNSNYSYKIRSYFVFVKCDICGSQGKIYNSPYNPVEAEWNTGACNDAVMAWNMRYNEREDRG